MVLRSGSFRPAYCRWNRGSTLSYCRSAILTEYSRRSARRGVAGIRRGRRSNHRHRRAGAPRQCLFAERHCRDLEERVQQRTAELAAANHNLGELSARLLHLQDEEGRRIARELHDSVGQTLAALSMNLAAVGADIERLAKTATTIADSTALVNDMSSDIRTISYLLHPPLLDEAGLSSALTWYIKGFSERSKIEVELRMPEDFGRLSRDLETAIFRVVQECLTNIHRHSGSSATRA